MGTRVDLLGVSNNVGLRRTFTLTTGAAVVPWAALPAWAPGAAYQSGASPSIVTFGGDLYMPASGAPASWTSASAFALEAAYWTLVAQAASFNLAPYSVAGKRLVLTITEAQADGVSPVLPLAPLITLTSDNSSSGLSIGGTSGNQVSMAVPDTRMRGLAPGVYCYDLVAIAGDSWREELFFGSIPVRQGGS